MHRVKRMQSNNFRNIFTHCTVNVDHRKKSSSFVASGILNLESRGATNARNRPWKNIIESSDTQSCKLSAIFSEKVNDKIRNNDKIRKNKFYLKMVKEETFFLWSAFTVQCIKIFLKLLDCIFFTRCIPPFIYFYVIIAFRMQKEKIV